MVAERVKKRLEFEKPNKTLVLIFLSGIFLRILYLYHHDLWFDEAFSFLVSTKSIPDIIKATISDNHPPLYEILLHFWIKVFGISEIMLRTFSLSTGVISMIIFYFLVKELTNKNITFLSLSIFSFSPLLIYYSGEARMYSLFVLLTLLTTYFFINLFKKSKITNLLLFIISMALTLYTHYYAILLYLPFMFIILRDSFKDKVRLISLSLISFVLFIPWLYYFFLNDHPGFINTNPLLAVPVTFTSFILGGTDQVTLRTYFESFIPIWIKIFFALTSILVLFFSLIGSLYTIKMKNNIILLLFFVPLLFLFIIAFFVPIFSIRSTIFLAPFFYILIGIGLNRFSKQKIFLTLICTLLTVTNAIIFFYPVFKGLQNKNTAQSIHSELPILHTSILTYYPFKYYKPELDNILILKNPLTQKTISVIGGKIESIPYNKKGLILIETTKGSDESELLSIKRLLQTNYKVVSDKQSGAITVLNYNRL